MPQNIFSAETTSQNNLSKDREGCIQTYTDLGDDEVALALSSPNLRVNILDDEYLQTSEGFSAEERRYETNMQICAKLVAPYGNQWITQQLHQHSDAGVGVFMSWAAAVTRFAQRVSRIKDIPISELTENDCEVFLSQDRYANQTARYVLGLQSLCERTDAIEEALSHPLVEKFSESMLKKGRTLDTVYVTFHPVKEFLAWLCDVHLEFAQFDSTTVPVWRVTQEHVQGYRRYLKHRVDKGEIKNSTAQQYLRRVKTFFNLCYRDGFISAHPLQGVKEIESVPSEVNLPKEAEVEEFFKVVLERSDRPLTDFLAFLGLLLLGLRSIELAKLQWENVNMRERLMTCWRKGGNYQLIPIPSAFVECLCLLDAERCGGIFTDNPESFCQDLYHRYRAYELLANWRRRTGVHIFRHLFVTSLTRGNYDVRTVMGLTGHVNPYILQRYIHREREELQQSVNKMNLKDVIGNDN